MIRLRLANALLTATCCVLPTGRAGAQRASVDTGVQRDTLDNGLQVIVAANHRIPLATVLVAMRNGSMTQDPGDEGLAHLYEHLLFRSYKGDPDAFGVEANDLDAYWNGTTSEEVVTYFLALPSKNALKGIGLIARLVRKPRFDAHDLKQERPVVLNELEREEADPEQALARQASRMLWGASWSRKDVGGDSSSLRGIALTRLEEMYERYYVPNNAALIITGDVVPGDVFTAAREQFGPWARASDPFAQPVPPIAPLTTSGALLMAQPVAHATILVKYRGPSAGRNQIAPDAVDLLCDVLDEDGSPFQQHLTGTGLFQSVQCDYQTLANVGPITFRGETTPERVTAALTALLHELDALARLDGVTTEDITIAKKQHRVAAALAVESSYALAPDLAASWSVGGVAAFDRNDQRDTTLGLVDLKSVAATYVSAQPRIIAVLAPSDAIPGLQAVLRPAASTIERAP